VVVAVVIAVVADVVVAAPEVVASVAVVVSPDVTDVVVSDGAPVEIFRFMFISSQLIRQETAMTMAKNNDNIL
jgi:hypothetical protein